ncbi:sigma-70 family RNA polymerase sigma factor [Egibacter rhizosphaerae]|uniref:Sigma-70 family RNA polymerase sigma factor n=1 Tax=Egibacter rhizosphaerae TaxID=1670831 RepID=A0A411YFA9_9ACTN|nr:sigma-70 family RNA polymerase sigma factor [Egibacter rhizosphaerae]QBI19861.1 sigma-70 family RNA polymerase sigma factor [Egibacter rhizosphaerae]
MQGFRNGDRDQFAEVFAAHVSEVGRLAQALCGNSEVARDATAEAFAKTYEQWRRGRVDRVAGYVRRAVVNEVNSHFRRVGRQRTFESRRRGDGRADTPAPEQHDDADRVRVLLEELPERQRTAVVLRYWADLSVEEVAEAMGCPNGTAKSLLSRGLARLREGAELAGDREGEAP